MNSSPIDALTEVSIDSNRSRIFKRKWVKKKNEYAKDQNWYSGGEEKLLPKKKDVVNNDRRLELEVESFSERERKYKKVEKTILVERWCFAYSR